MSQPEEIQGSLYDNMRKLISTIDELKDVGVQKFIQLPRIAVIGSQSSGKSSLLEAIVGFDFLPRGEGLVTRRPLELRLVHVAPNKDEQFRPYAEFSNDGKMKYYDFDKVRERIISLTEQVAGKSKKIIDDPITMTIYSTTCPDLTLVDLPGITRIAQSDQPFDIEKVTKDMCRRYAKDKRTIILAVMPANQDMSLSDSLKMAREEDPQGLRTIGVLTKIDIMDEGSDARRMLLGEDIPLRLGYVGVKGRSQFDINKNMKVAEALKIEKNYFANHATYSKLPSGYLGTEVLTQKLTKVLFGHIRNTLPEITKEIQDKIRECEDKMKDLGEPLPSSQKDKMQLLWNMVSNFTDNFKNNLQGRYDPKRNTRVTGELSGAARIKLMFQNLYSEFANKRATEGISDNDIHRAIIMHQESLPGFHSFDSFLYLITPILNQLRDPALELVNNIHLYLESLAAQLIEKNFVRFPSIMDDITETVNKALREEKNVAQDLVENIIESEKTYIFTNDVEYMTQRTSIVPAAVEGRSRDNRPISPEKLFIDEMRARIDVYFSIVMRNIKDTIPKLLGTFLVRTVQDKMQFILYNEINKNEQIMEMMNEPSHIKAERETLTNIITVLTKARLVLTKDPNLTSNPNEKIPSHLSKPKATNQPPVMSRESNVAPNPSVRTAQNNPFNPSRDQPPSSVRNPSAETLDSSLFGADNIVRPNPSQINTNPPNVPKTYESANQYSAQTNQAQNIRSASDKPTQSSQPVSTDPLIREQKQGFGAGWTSPFGKQKPPN